MRRFIECLIPNSTCNLECSYCYLIQEGRRKQERGIYKYSPEIIGKALSKERLGGISLISMTAQGETMLSPEIPEIAREILKQGHFINITTNGTQTQRFEKLLSLTEGFHSHIHISFSFHYIELKKRNLIETFFSNIKKIHKAGCSILLQINLVDEYIPFWKEIKELSLKYVGALPQAALTRDESNGTFKPLTKLNFEEYKKIGNEMESPLFEFTCKNFMVKRKEFCFAGLWTAALNMSTGILSGCYGQGFSFNIFEDLNSPIPFRPIGKRCKCQYCLNSSHFLSQGAIPSLLPLLSYGELRNRKQAGWYTAEMEQFLYKQFTDVNPFPSKFQILRYNLRNSHDDLKTLLRRFIFHLHFRLFFSKLFAFFKFNK